MISLSEAWSLAIKPPDRRSIEEWAGENVTMPAVLTIRGKFSTAASRHFIAPLQALRHDSVRGVRLLKPVRGGGTLIADVSVPWAKANDNASILWVFQDDSIADEHAEMRQMPIIKSVPALRAMLPANRHQQRKSDIIFSDGLPLTLVGPAIGGLQSKGYKWVVCDEAWLYKPGILGQAKSRMGDFVKMSANKFLVISQGGEEESDWDLEYKEGVEFVWNVPCAGCNTMISPEWTILRPDGSKAGMRYDSVKNEDGTYNKDACASTARFICPHCSHEHPNTQKTRSDWNRSGDYFNSKTGARWDPLHPPTECSFRWHSMIDYPWFDLVKEWLSANEAKHVGNFAPLVSFFQKRCALMRSENTIHGTDLPFARMGYQTVAPAEKLWPGEAMRFMTCDRQSEDTYWCLIRAWGDKTGESRRVWFGKLYSEADIEAKRIEYGIDPSLVVVDSGYRPKGDHGVYSACIRYGWIAAKGAKEPFFWHIEPRGDGLTDRVQKPWAPTSHGDPGEGTSRQGVSYCKLVRFSADVMAERVMSLINLGFWIEPDIDQANEMEREYKTQMSAEWKRTKKDEFTGKVTVHWVSPSQNNHAFDCSKMQVLCAMHTHLLPSGLEISAPTETTVPAEKTT